MKFLSIMWSLLLAVLLMASGQLWAERVENLYGVQLAVDSQSRQELKRASKEGLAVVFVRLSGNAEVLQNPAIIQALSRSQSFLKQYRYERLRASDEQPSQLMVSLEFEPELLRAELRAAAMPIWPHNRPSLLVWLAVGESGAKSIANAESQPQLVNLLSAHGQRRGLPLQLPLLDLEDSSSLPVERLWQMDQMAVEEASSRYMPDTVLMGRVSHLSTGKWLGSWLFLFDGHSYRFDGNALDLDTYLASAIDQAAELMAAKYAIAPVKIAEGGVLMRVTGVQSFEDYARLVTYLQGLGAIQHADLMGIEGGEVILRLTAEGQLQQLQQTLLRGGRLQLIPPVSETAIEGSINNDEGFESRPQTNVETTAIDEEPGEQAAEVNTAESDGLGDSFFGDAANGGEPKFKTAPAVDLNYHWQ